MSKQAVFLQAGALLLLASALWASPSPAAQPRIVEVPAGPAFGSGHLCLECKSFCFYGVFLSVVSFGSRHLEMAVIAIPHGSEWLRLLTRWLNSSPDRPRWRFAPAPLHADSPGPRRSTAEFADHADPWALFSRLPSSG